MKLRTYYTQLHLDLHTPVSAYLCLRDKYARSLLLESSDHQLKEGNYSFIVCDPISSFTVSDQTIQILENNKIEKRPLIKGSLANELQSYASTFETEELNVTFPYSAIFGYTSFDVIGTIEDHLNKEENSLIPELIYSFYSLLLVFDHAKHQAHLVSFANTTKEAEDNANIFEQALSSKTIPSQTFDTIEHIKYQTSDSEFLSQVKLAKQHCKMGDVFQLVLSRRFKQNFVGDEFNVYRCLKQINPSPYLFYYDMGSFKIFGSSPEAQLVVKDGVAEIHPIAGTYKRTGDDIIDKMNAEKLENDPKENSEHFMLVDLARNDLSTSCTNVKVERLKELNYFSHVIHLISKVTGTLKENKNSVDLLFSSFPAGTLSGAPKHKALQLISKYEKESRNFYGGCVGFIETNGNINHAIMIRSFLSKDSVLHFQAGAGIVIDSIPENELQEIDNKVGALKKALQEANKLNKIITFA